MKKNKEFDIHSSSVHRKILGDRQNNVLNIGGNSRFVNTLTKNTNLNKFYTLQIKLHLEIFEDKN